MKRTSVSGAFCGSAFALLCGLPIVGAAIEPAPSPALLEFLGEWETTEGEWLDPIQLLEALDLGVSAEQNIVPQQVPEHAQEEHDDD
jgi:hypothetical protein